MRPSELDDLAPVIGYAATRIIAVAFAGRLLHVPRQALPGHPLETLIGGPALAALVREFPGERFSIPTAAQDEQCRRDWRAAQWFAEGRSASDVAADLDITQRRAQQLRAELVTRGWLRYLQGFDTAMAHEKARRPDVALPERLPLNLGTGEVSG